jgi:hypothetical protein
MKLVQPLEVFLPDTRGVEVSRYGRGNTKIGMSVYTYSRHAGMRATCPGSTPLCEAICYAKRIGGEVLRVYDRNAGSDVPPIPADAKLLRIHVSGDFNSVAYVESWIARLVERPDVQAWAYTRSWRVPELLPVLEQLRAVPNMQLFASMDDSTPDRPPMGWRRAWIDGDMRADYDPTRRHDDNRITDDDVSTYVCPEETGRQPDCERCGYCIRGKRFDVTFLKH